MGKVMGICISKIRGIQKTEIGEANLIENWGIEKDAHAGDWHRQVSLLGLGEIEGFRARGAEVDYGAFGENIIVDGYRMKDFPVGTRFRISDAVLELTQIGKECHSHCAIYKTVGDCIMPREGVFARVIRGGHIKDGDEITVLEPQEN